MNTPQAQDPRGHLSQIAVRPRRTVRSGRVRLSSPGAVALAGAAIGLAVLGGGGCTAESTRVAIETQQRANDVQQAVVEQQHTALCVLLYRDMLRRLGESGVQLNDANRAALNDVWNERDLVEFWTVQFERSKALRTIGVDTRLYSEQSIIDLLWKAITLRADWAQAGLAASAGTELSRRLMPGRGTPGNGSGAAAGGSSSGPGVPRTGGVEEGKIE